MCPVCNERLIAFGNIMCLTCWHYVPVDLQKAVRLAQQDHTRENTVMSMTLLDALAAEAYKRAEQRRATIDDFKAREDLANKLG